MRLKNKNNTVTIGEYEVFIQKQSKEHDKILREMAARGDPLQ